MYNIKIMNCSLLLLGILCCGTSYLFPQEYKANNTAYQMVRSSESAFLNKDTVKRKMELLVRPGIKLSEEKKHTFALSTSLAFPLGQKWKIMPGISYWQEENLLYDETSSCYGIFILIEYNFYINDLSFFIGTGGGQYKFSNHSGVYFGLILDTGAAYKISRNISVSAGINYPIVFENSGSGRSAVLPIVFIGANISL